MILLTVIWVITKPIPQLLIFLSTMMRLTTRIFFFFFFNDPAPPEISPLSPPDSLPISRRQRRERGLAVVAAADAAGRCGRPRQERAVGRHDVVVAGRACARRVAALPVFVVRERAGDRKSQRLNPSHLLNSYAAFSFKKK